MLFHKAEGSIFLGFPNINGSFSGIDSLRQPCPLRLKFESFYMLPHCEVNIVFTQVCTSVCFFLTRPVLCYRTPNPSFLAEVGPEEIVRSYGFNFTFGTL